MKVYFKNMLKAYRGACDGLIYYYNPRLNRLLVRTYAKPRKTENNRLFGRVARNLRELNPSDAFIRDMTIYADIHLRRAKEGEPVYNNWYMAYTRMMYNLPKHDPYVQLETLTRNQIETNDLPCRSVKRAVEAGLLESVPGYELLDKLM
jgi:hypothetical protein